MWFQILYLNKSLKTNQMKTTLLFTCLVILALSLMNSPAVVAQYKPMSPTFGTDVVVIDSAAFTYAKSEISVADNGYIYMLVRFNYNIPDYNTNGCMIWRSTDGGLNFNNVFWLYYLTEDYILADIDFVVTGNDPSNIRIWVAEVTNMSSNVNLHSRCTIRRFNANGTQLVTPYDKDWGGPPNTLYNVSIATDYRSPGFGTDPFAIAMAYTVHNAGSDYLMYVYSLDGGVTWIENELYNQAGENLLGEVSLSLGATQTYNLGYYAVAFECNKTGVLGDIGVIMNYTNNEGTWTTPVLVNQRLLPAGGKACRPSIALMDNVLANPANTVVFPMVVAYEDWGTTENEVNITYNTLLDTYTVGSQAILDDFSSHWLDGYNADLENEYEPDLCFDKTYNNFLVTYFNTDGNRLAYAYATTDGIHSNTWTIHDNYRDASTPYTWYVAPKVDINPANTSACFSWTEQDPDDDHQIVYFDAEWSTVGIDNPLTSAASFSLYPNPAYDKVMVNITKPGNYEVTVSNLTGKTIMKQNADERTNVLNLEGLNAGVYFVKVSGGGLRSTQKLIVK
jgi:hypothetical protein